MHRRKFFSQTAWSAAGMITGSALQGWTKAAGPEPARVSPSAEGRQRYDLMQEAMRYRKIDAHAHIYWTKDSPGKQLDFGQRLRIDWQVISRYLDVMPGTPEQFRKFNDLTIRAIRQYPDQLLGGFVLNPAYKQAALDEIKRCTEAGMIGPGELYYQDKINDPSYYPIIEKLIDLKMIIFSHAECQLGVGGYRMKYDGHKQPNTSVPEDFVDLAKRYPEGTFQYAHIGGGGDWEYACKLFRDYPNIYVDTSGSNNAEHMIDFAVAQLGVERLLFGSDNSYYQSVGKVLAADLNDHQRQKIFFDNYNNLLKKGGRNVD